MSFTIDFGRFLVQNFGHAAHVECLLRSSEPTAGTHQTQEHSVYVVYVCVSKLEAVVNFPIWKFVLLHRNG